MVGDRRTQNGRIEERFVPGAMGPLRTRTYCPEIPFVHRRRSSLDGGGGIFGSVDLYYIVRREPDRNDPRLSPLRVADFSGLPQAHIHTAEFDPLRDEGEA
jgi:acetyl esterase/lipase